MARRRTLFLTVATTAIVALGRPDWGFLRLGLIPVVLGEIVRLWAAGYLKKCGEVSSSGPFGFVRNPLYIGSTAIMLGYCVMANNILVSVVAMALFCVFHLAAILYEEWYLTHLFGDKFTAYCKSVPRLIPRWPRNKEAARYSLRQVRENREHVAVMYAAVTILAFALRIVFTKAGN